MIWTQFLVCSALLVGAAITVSRYADVLAEKTGLGRTWMGAVVLAAATSLPEFAAGTTAVVVLGSPDLAAGLIFGSCLFNLALIAVMDLIYQPGRILASVEEGNLLSSGLGILVAGIASTSILLSGRGVAPALGSVGLTSLLILGLYLVGMRLLFRFEKQRQVQFLKERAKVLDYAHIPAARAYAIFVLGVAAVFGLGVWLASIAESISSQTGLSLTFVGSLFLALATSLPEVVVSVTAVRLGAIDLAVGNVLGSNLLNMALLGVFDVVYSRGNLWSALSSTHAVAGLIVIMMTGVVMVSLVYRVSPRTPYRFTWDAAALLAIYLGGMAFLFTSRGGS